MIRKKTNQSSYSQILFLHQLLEGRREISEEEAAERISILEIEKQLLPCYVVCISSDYSHIPYQKKDGAIYECERYVAAFFEKQGIRYCTVTNSENNVQAILHTESGKADEELLIRLHEKLLTDLGLDQFIGIGSVVNEYGKIAVSSAEATDMLAYKYQYAEKGVINITNIVRFQFNSNYGNNDMFDRVIGCFRDGNLSRMAVRIDELVHEIRYRPKVSGTSIKRTMIELTVHILTIASNANVDVDSVLNGEDPYNWILRQEATEVITEWIMSLASQLLEKIREQQETRGNRIIQSACDYIHSNLGNPALGLQSVCDHVELSGPYLSHLFKEETGVGISSYITAQRIRFAQELLSGSNLKIEEIARQTGFSRMNYFSNVFKKEVGISPGTYRKNNKSKRNG